MSNKRDIMRAIWPVLGLIVGALLCLALSLLMSGCKTKYITQEVPVVVEHTTHEKSACSVLVFPVGAKGVADKSKQRAMRRAP